MKPLIYPPLVGSNDLQLPEGESSAVLLLVDGEIASAMSDQVRSQLGLIAADAQRALKRMMKRAAPPSEEYERVEIKQTRGPTVEFTGRLLGNDEWETRGRDPLRLAIEIWETEGGAFVAASYSELADREGFEDARAIVVEPGGDEQERRFTVMDFFAWENRARSLARKLGWSLRVEVE